MTKPHVNFRRKLARLYDKLQDENVEDGQRGKLNAASFRVLGLKAVKAKPEDYGFVYVMDEYICSELDATWRNTGTTPETEATDQPSLFMIGSVPIEKTYTIYDVNSPTGYSRVAGQHALLSHVKSALQVKEDKHEEAGKALELDRERYGKLFARLDGQMERRLWDFKNPDADEAAA